MTMKYRVSAVRISDVTRAVEVTYKSHSEALKVRDWLRRHDHVATVTVVCVGE